MGWRDGKAEEGVSGGGWRSGTAEEDDGKTGRIKAFLGGNLQGITGNHFDELSGALMAPFIGGGVEPGAGAQPAPDDTPEVRSAKETLLHQHEAAPSNYEIGKGLVQAELDRAQQDRPWEFGGGRVTGTLLTAPFAGRALTALGVPMAGLGGAMATGGVLGAVGGAGESRAELTRGDFLRYLKDAGVGAGLGVAGGALGYGFSQGLQGLPGAASSMLGGFGTGAIMSGATSEGETWKDKVADALGDGILGAAGGLGGYGMTRLGNAALTGAVKPTPEAQRLRDMGVDNLTVGLMDPKSAIGQIEEIGQGAAVVGPSIKSQREAPLRTYGKAAISEVVPEGGSSLAKGSINEQVADAYRQINEKYDSVRGSPLSPRAQARPPNVRRIAQAFDAAVKDPDIAASPHDLGTAKNFLANQAAILDRSGPSVKNLMRVRSNIRDAMDALPGNHPLREIYGRTADSITNRLDYALPKSAAETLRKTDAGYGAYKSMEGAVANAKDRATLTPNDITMGIKSNTDAGQYARGAGGPLRELARAGHEVFDAQTPKTGYALLASGKYNPLPWVAKVANNPSVKPYVLGEAPIQARARALIGVLRNGAPAMAPMGGRLLPEMLESPPQMTPAMADEDELHRQMLAEAIGRR